MIGLDRPSQVIYIIIDGYGDRKRGDLQPSIDRQMLHFLLNSNNMRTTNRFDRESALETETEYYI